MRRNIVTRLGAPLIVVALLGAACGGGDDDESASKKKSTSSAEDTTTTTSTTLATETTIAGETTTSLAAPVTTAPRRVANAAATRNQASVNQTRQLNSGPETTLAPELNRPPADWNPDGELRIAYAAPPSSMDPLSPVALQPFLFPLYDRLTEMADDYTVKPRLATSWSFPDAKTMVIKLRTGVKFHDGTVFDAAAVKANLDRSRTLPTSRERVALGGISNVEVVDPSTVKLTLSKAGAELPVTFAQFAGMMISPAVIANNPDDIGTKGAGGSGPYKIEAYKVGESATYTRNPDFWDKKQGLLKKMTLLGILNGPQRLNALKSNDVDLAQVISNDVAGAKREIAAGTLKGVLANLTATQNGLFLRDTLPPFNNAKVREALAYALDKKALSEGLYSGTCLPASQFFLENHWSHNKAITGRYSFDQAKAKQLLAESGVKDLSITLDYGAIYQQPAQAMQQMLNEVGFDAKIALVPAGDTSFRDGKRQALVSPISGVYDPSQLVSGFALGGNNLLRDPDGSSAALAARGGDPTGNQTSWSAAYQQLWDRIFGQFLIVPTCNAQQVWAHLGKVANADDIRYKFSGLVDFSYLYVKK